LRKRGDVYIGGENRERMLAIISNEKKSVLQLLNTHLPELDINYQPF
jgi:hypothetical protein